MAPLQDYCSSDIAVVLASKSPKSGTIFESNVGGAAAAELKYAGYDGVIIRGKAPKPVYLSIRDNEVEIRDANSLWGKGIFDTEQGLKILEKDPEIKTLSLVLLGRNLFLWHASVVKPIGSWAAEELEPSWGART